MAFMRPLSYILFKKGNIKYENRTNKYVLKNEQQTTFHGSDDFNRQFFEQFALFKPIGLSGLTRD